MTAASAPSWPGGRVLLGWWRELAGRHPQQLHISRLLLHRVEALIRVRRSSPLDRWQRALLHLAHTRLPCHGELLSSFSDLQIDLPFLSQLVRELTDTGLLHRNGSGTWQMTPAGRDALKTGALSVAAEERRCFVFVDHSSLGRPPHILPLKLGPARFSGPTPPEAAGCSFAVASLEVCIQQTPEWKARYRFPMDVEAVVLPRPDDPAAANRHRVILDTVEVRPLVFIRSAPATGAPLTLGFAVKTEGWTLEPDPVLTLGDGCEDALPELTTEPTPEMWRQAWQAWTHPRSLPSPDVEACRLERVDHRLIVHSPPRLIERLRAARSDAVKQEAWLLAGVGGTRTAAQIELRPFVSRESL
jgi:hypothetical protein